MENLSGKVGTIIQVHSIGSVGVYYSVMFADKIKLLEEREFVLVASCSNDD